MRALLVLALMMMVAGTALTYGYYDVSVGVIAVAAVAPQPDEPASLLVYGGVLLGLARVLRRYV